MNVRYLLVALENVGYKFVKRFCKVRTVIVIVFIFVLLGKKTSVDKPLLEYMNKKLNTR